MQSRDYDDYIYVSSILGFRKVNDAGNEILVNQETDGYCSLYANNCSVSYLHNMNDSQLNAIHYFEKHHPKIFEVLVAHLSEKYKNPRLEVGFRHVNILDIYMNEICNVEYTFIDSTKKNVKITMHQLKLMQ